MRKFITGARQWVGKQLLSAAAIAITMAVVFGASFAIYNIIPSKTRDMTTVYIYAQNNVGKLMQGIKINSFQKNSRYGGGQLFMMATGTDGAVMFEIEKGYPAHITISQSDGQSCADAPYAIGLGLKKWALDGVQYVFNPETCTFLQNGSLGTL
jgi:hypothetical protein